MTVVRCNDFVNMTQKLDLRKIKNLCPLKDILKKMKKWAIDRNMTHISEKGLVLRIHKKALTAQ